MATADKVIVELAVKMGEYTKDVGHARELFSKAMDAISRDGKKAANDVDKSFSGLGGKIKLAFAGVSAAVLAREAMVMIDTWKRATNALKVAGVEGADLTSVMDQLFASAQRNAVPIEALSTLYGRAAQAADNLGASQADLIKFSNGVAVALRVSGTSADQAQGALLQLGQLLGQARVQAEEFNSVNEGAPAIMKAVARGIDAAGGSISKLKQLVNDGAISGQQFFDAFLTGIPQLQQQAEKAGQTFEQAFTKINNAFTKYIGQTDETLGASARLIEGLNALADNFEGTADIAIKLAAVFAGLLVGRAIGGLLAVVPLAIFGFKAFGIAAQGASAAAEMLALKLGATSKAALAAAASVKAIQMFAFLRLLPIIGAVVTGASVALYAFSRSSEEAAAKSEAFKRKLVDLGYLSEQAAEGIDKTTAAINNLHTEELRIELEKTNEQIRQLTEGSAFSSALPDSLDDVIQKLRAIQTTAAMDEIATDESKAAAEMQGLIEQYEKGIISAEQLNKQLDALASKQVSGVLDGLIAEARVAIRLLAAALAYKNALLSQISGVTTGPSSDDADKRASVEANRLLREQNTARDKFIGERKRYSNLSDLQKDIEDRAKTIITSAKAAKISLNEEQAMLQATAEVNKEYADAEAKKAASGGGRKGKKSAEDKAADKAARNTSIADLKEETALLQKEAEVVGLGAEAREKALTAMKLENDLRHDNVKITPEVVASIEAESTAYAKAKEHLADLERQTQQMHDLQQFVGDNMVDILSGIATGATTAEDALKGLVDQLLRAMLQAMLLGQGPLAGLFGLGGGTSTGVGGMVGMMFGGARAGGGPVMPGRAYMVGEKGPELFVPRMAGVVQSSGGSGHTQVSVHITPSPLLITTWDTKATAAENRAVARGPAVARNNNQRYSVP